MPSFSSSVKEHIIESLTSDGKARAALYGAFHFARVTDAGFVFLTENETIAAFVYDTLKIRCGVKSAYVDATDNKRCIFSVTVSDPDEVDELIALYGSGEFKIPDELLKYKSQVLAGIFLASGSVADPNKEYHLEFVLPSVAACEALESFLTDSFGINARHTARKGQSVVYVKESENIEDLLTLMGASKFSLEIMNIKILKNVRNKVNRVLNCENANIERTVTASERQVADIELIEKTVGLSSLDSELYETAVLRYENPELSLKELGEMFTPKITKSGVNHRLERIKSIANNIRENGGK